MKREWQVHRSTVEHTDGQRRWDRAYQCLLRWTNETTSRLNEHSSQLAQWEAKPNESRHLCSGLDVTPTEKPDD